jgi:hypothetical protein
MERVIAIETGSTGSHSAWRTRFRRGYTPEGNGNESETSNDNVPPSAELLAAVSTNPEHPATDHTQTGFPSSLSICSYDTQVPSCYCVIHIQSSRLTLSKIKPLPLEATELSDSTSPYQTSTPHISTHCLQ